MLEEGYGFGTDRVLLRNLHPAYSLVGQEDYVTKVYA